MFFFFLLTKSKLFVYYLWWCNVISSRHDFIIFQVPDQPPVNITENGFPDKVQTRIHARLFFKNYGCNTEINLSLSLFLCQVRLCFLNGNHYDSVYPQSFEKSAAVCQCECFFFIQWINGTICFQCQNRTVSPSLAILYEVLYDRVCGVERGVLGPCMKGGRGREKLDSEECKSSEESDLEEDEFWFVFACLHDTFSVAASFRQCDYNFCKLLKSGRCCIGLVSYLNL